MTETIITVDGYKTVAHIFVTDNEHYIVVINSKITGIGGTNFKQVVAHTRQAIKRRG